MLENTLDLVAHSWRVLGALGLSEREFRVPSKRRPGEVNVETVTVAAC